MATKVTLYREQWLILLFMALVLALGLDWGMPSQRRVELLTFGMKMSPQQIKEHYRRTEPPPGQGTRREDERVLSDWHKYQNFWDCVLYSAATDEWHTYGQLAAMNPRELDFRIRRQVYGGAFIYGVGAVLLALKAVGVVQAVPNSLFYLEHPEQMARIQMSGRALVVACFLGALVLLGLWGNRLGGRAAGDVAMAAWAFSPLAFVHALVTKPHVFAAFWGLWGLYLLARYLDEPKAWRLAASLGACGVAMGANLVAACLALAYPVMLWNRGDLRGWLLRCIWCGLGLLLVFGLTNPYTVMDPGSLLREVGQHASGQEAQFLDLSWPNTLRSLKNLLLAGYVFPLGLLALAEGARTLCSAQAPVALRRLALVAAVWLALFIPTSLGLGRLSLFVGPLICLFAGLGAARLLARLPSGRPAWRVGLAGLLLAPAALAFIPQARDVIWDQAWYQPTRAWLAAADIGPGTSLGIMGSTITPNIYPPFPFLPATVVNLEHYRPGDPLPRYVVIGAYGERRSAWRRHPLYPRYRQTRNLGYRSSWDWLPGLQFKSEARLAGWVYEPRSVINP